uniref:transmembrane protein 232-like n=1 Tax=Styela clava TaxID=7725 RepID=UPI00193ABE2D|nr:transmembrane protein 232-like [Styela clava]
MPVLKIPIVHKFGIISHSQRLALQERLLRQNYARENAAAAAAGAHIRANPLEVCEKFVQRYNASTFEGQEPLRAEAERILIHSKRRAGILTQGEGDHVDLPMAWSELAILAQCKGKLQEDCFEILCQSLNHAPVHEENIPTLFFLAESTLYWLRTDTINSTQLRTAEIRLLKMGFLVFVRLYYHHLVNNLIQLDEFKSRLSTYLEGIQDHEMLYKSYPGVWLAIRFISRVGGIITAPHTTESQTEQNEDDPNEMPTILIRPIVYQALHVWRCKDKEIGLKRAILDVLICAKDFCQEDWVDSLFALSILGDSAKANSFVCRSFQDLARGVAVPISQIATPRTTEFMMSTASPKKYTAGNATDNLEESARDVQSDSFQNIMQGMMADFDSSLGKTPRGRSTKRNTTAESNFQSEMNRSKTNSYNQSSNLPGTSRLTPTRGSGISNPNTPRSEMSESIVTGISAWRWEIAYQYSQILTDICLHGATAPIQKLAMLGKWLDADVTTFRAGVPNFCIESCGLVDLLEYRNPRIDPYDKTSSRGAGSNPADWSWKVRYGALSGLLHLTHALREDKLKEGMRSAAWSLIVSLQDSAATEDCVLEALRVGQVEYPDFTKTIRSSTSLNIWSRISHSLTDHFLLPTLPIPRSPSSLANPSSQAFHSDTRQSTRISPRTKETSPGKQAKHSVTSPRQKPPPNRTTLKDHLEIPNNTDKISTEFHKRNALNLQRVIEDQWRKQLIKEHKEDEKVRMREIKVKQKEEEIHMQEVAEKRKEKLRGKMTRELAPYELP